MVTLRNATSPGVLTIRMQSDVFVEFVDSIAALAPAREKSEPAPVAQEPKQKQVAAFVRAAGFKEWENSEASAQRVARYALSLAAAPTAAQGLSDADRYQLLRRGQQFSVINGIGDTLRAEALDAALDAILNAAQETKP